MRADEAETHGARNELWMPVSKTIKSIFCSKREKVGGEMQKGRRDKTRENKNCTAERKERKVPQFPRCCSNHDQLIRTVISANCFHQYSPNHRLLYRRYNSIITSISRHHVLELCLPCQLANFELQLRLPCQMDCRFQQKLVNFQPHSGEPAVKLLHLWRRKQQFRGPLWRIG